MRYSIPIILHLICVKFHFDAYFLTGNVVFVLNSVFIRFYKIYDC